MMKSYDTEHKARQALLIWIVFIIILVILNGTIPFALGTDMREWSISNTRLFLISFIIYGGVFLVIPLIIVKGWKTVRQPGFLIPLIIAVLATSLWFYYRGIGVVAIFVLVYLHRKFNLSELGIRTYGWKGDIFAIILSGSLRLILLYFQGPVLLYSPGKAIFSALWIMMTDPTMSLRILFYFGFLTERISCDAGKWLTPILIGLMFTTHEMTNPGYWYVGMDFPRVFIIITFFAFLYVWRRSVIMIWLGHGLEIFITRLIH